MHILPLIDLLGSRTVQARFRGKSEGGWGIFELARELAGLAGLLGWLGVLFYLVALLATGPTV